MANKHGNDDDEKATAPPGAHPSAPNATGSPDTRAIRGFPPERRDRYPVSAGASDAADRAAADEAAAAAAHAPLGPAGYVEARDTTGGPATSFAERTADPTQAPGLVGDVLVVGPDAAPAMPVLPPRSGEEEEGQEPYPEPSGRPFDPSSTRWLTPFARTLQTTREWMRDVANAVGARDPRDARHALEAVLTTLRDQLPVAEIADLAATLPLPVRGLLLEGWTGRPVKVHTRKELLTLIADRLGPRARVEPEDALKGVLEVLRRRVPAGELDDIEAVLPAELKWMVAAPA